MDTITVVLGRDTAERVCLMCGVPAVVRINGTPACREHLDPVMTQAFGPLYRLLGLLTFGVRPPEE